MTATLADVTNHTFDYIVVGKQIAETIVLLTDFYERFQVAGYV